MNAELDHALKELKRETEIYENVVCEKVQMKIENEIAEKMDDALAEAKRSTKKMMIVVVVGCMIMIGLSKLVG